MKTDALSSINYDAICATCGGRRGEHYSYIEKDRKVTYCYIKDSDKWRAWLIFRNVPPMRKINPNIAFKIRNKK